MEKVLSYKHGTVILLLFKHIKDIKGHLLLGALQFFLKAQADACASTFKLL